ncbi:MAG: aryl-sulfate sulfotransferase [Candidatus Thorarchaeota archaeon]
MAILNYYIRFIIISFKWISDKNKKKAFTVMLVFLLFLTIYKSINPPLLSKNNSVITKNIMDDFHSLSYPDWNSKKQNTSLKLQNVKAFDSQFIDTEINLTINGDYFDGYNLFVLGQTNRTDPTYKKNVLIFCDMQGNVILEKLLHESTKGVSSLPVQFINSSTIFYGEPESAALWNIYTNKTEYLNQIGHHEYEYNPISETFFTLQGDSYTINGSTYTFDKIVEFNKMGDIIWTLPLKSFISHTQWCPFQDMNSGGSRDLVHPNSIYFDSENDIIFLNCRNINTFFKIDHKSSEVIWGLGEYGNFTMYNRRGEEVQNLFYHAHSVEPVDENTFILFDNDLHNQSNPLNHRSRLLEVTIDETTMTAHESWSWIPPSEYYSDGFGDADRLPNGNRLGTFGTKWHPNNIGARLVEVNKAGEIVWKLDFINSNEFYYTIYRMERIRFFPIVNSSSNLRILSNKRVINTWQTWYNFRPKRQMIGSYSLYLNKSLIETGSHEFDRYWRGNNFTVDLGKLESGNYNLTLVLSDEDDHLTIDTINIMVVPFYFDRVFSQDIELGQTDSVVLWTGESIQELSIELMINNSLEISHVWINSDIELNTDSLQIGLNNITLRVLNNSELIYYDTIWVNIHPSTPPRIDLSPNDQKIEWNKSLLLIWKFFDYSPVSWKIIVDEVTVREGNYKDQYNELRWQFPLQEEGLYNVTLLISDSIQLSTKNTVWVEVIPPGSPIISSVPQSKYFQWGQSESTLTWEVHGGTDWILWRNETLLKGSNMNENKIHQSMRWQEDKWILGRYNLTLQVFNEKKVSALRSTWIEVFYSYGDAYANAFEFESSKWYLNGEAVLGAPNGESASIFKDYGNGYITVDMGYLEEIVDGSGPDFTIIAQGGEYTVYGGRILTAAFTELGFGKGNLSLDLSLVDLDSIRYIRIEYRTGDIILVDAILAYNFNHIEDDIEPPLITGPEDFSVWQNQTKIVVKWTIIELTPWNYSIIVNDEIVENKPWKGSDITIDLVTSNFNTEIILKLIVFDLFGNKAEDIVKLKIIIISTSKTKTANIESIIILISMAFLILRKKRNE